MANGESKAWSLSNTIMAAMGALIILLLTLGITLMLKDRDSLVSLIKDGDVAINGQLSEIKQQHKDSNSMLYGLVKEMGEFKTQLAIMKTNQDVRLEKERLDNQRKAIIGVK